MIAITILSFIMLSIVTITDGSQQTKDRVISEDRHRLQLETAMSRFEWDFSQIYSPLYFSHKMKPQERMSEEQIAAYEFFIDSYSSNNRFKFPSYDGLPVPSFELRDKNTFTFLTTANRRKLKNIKQSHFAWVNYSLENDESNEAEKGRFMLVRRAITHNIFDKDELDWSKTKPQILLRSVESLKIELWNSKTKKWVDNINTIKNGQHLIRGVKLTMEWLDKDQIPRVITRVFRPNFPEFSPEDMYKLKLTSTLGDQADSESFDENDEEENLFNEGSGEDEGLNSIEL